MAICNLFNKISNSTGTFLQFSQYSEDLSQMISGGSLYRIEPSKFVAAYINFKHDNGIDDWNIIFPTELQNYFENGCACIRDLENWSPEISKNLFWNFLFDKQYLTTKQISNDTFINQIKCVCDIDLTSYNQWDGMGYNEIYCYIPNQQKSYFYGISELSNPEVYEYNENYIKGYSNESPSILNGSLIPPTNYIYGRRWVMSFEDDLNGQGVTTVENTEESQSFEINTIILLYDIYSYDNQGNKIKLFSDIPMGIYLPGQIVTAATEDDKYKNGEVFNTITKYISNEDIYGAGTSYGLRICSRLTPTPNNDNIPIINISATSDTGVSRVLSGMADIQSKMQDMLQDFYIKEQNLKELYAIFKNSRTNVPYIKEVNGKKMWFVNGRSLNTYVEETIESNNECIPATASEIQQTIDDYEKELTPSLSLSLSVNQRVFEKTIPATPVQIDLFWQVYYRGIKDSADQTYVNDTKLINNPTRYTSDSISEDTIFTVNVIKGSLSASSSVSIQFVNPTYIGYTLLEDINEDEIKSGQKYLKTTIANTYKFNPENQRIFIAYPKEYGYASQIIDIQAQINIIDQFIKKDVQVNGEEYIYYTSKDPKTILGWDLQIK